MLTGLNHITIAVNDLRKSLLFYVDLLGLEIAATWPDGAYLSLGELWLCLIVDKVTPRNDYFHIAFSIDKKDFAQFCEKLRKADIKIWQENQSEGDSLYILDPDENKLEIHVGDLNSRLANLAPEKVKIFSHPNQPR